jgi:hypothetical protein
MLQLKRRYAMAAQIPVPPATDKAMGGAERNFRRHLVLSFSLFGVFFIFYIVTAIIQTPTFKAVAGIPVLGLPLGMLLSLLIFPVSFLLIAVYFILWR